MTAPDLRVYEAAAQSTAVFGRVLLRARHHELLIDGPVQNGCLGEELTPGEAFLGAVAACGVELIEVIGRERGINVAEVNATITGIVDRANPVRPDVTVFNQVRMSIGLGGVDEADAGVLVDAFKARCPLFGTVAAATPDVVVEWSVV
jgi:uncharacterized OsmC-like protein